MYDFRSPSTPHLGTFKKGFRVSDKSIPILELGCFYIDHFNGPLSFQMLA